MVVIGYADRSIPISGFSCFWSLLLRGLKPDKGYESASNILGSCNSTILDRDSLIT